MERHEMQTREVEGTSFLQELGDTHACSYYNDSCSMNTQVTRIEKFPDVTLSVFEGDSSNVDSHSRTFISPSPGFAPNDRSDWDIDPSTRVEIQPTPSPDRQPPYWPPERCMNVSASYPNYRHPEQHVSQVQPHGTRDWRRSITQQSCVSEDKPNPQYSVVHAPINPISGHVYPSHNPFIQKFSIPHRSDGVHDFKEPIRDSGSSVSGQNILESHIGGYMGLTRVTDASNSLHSHSPHNNVQFIQSTERVPKESSRTSSIDAVDQKPSTHIGPFPLGHPISVESTASSQPVMSSMAPLSTSHDFTRNLKSSVNGSDPIRPLQQLGRMVSKSCTEGFGTAERKSDSQVAQTVSTATDSHQNPSFSSQITQNYVPPYNQSPAQPHSLGNSGQSTVTLPDFTPYRDSIQSGILAAADCCQSHNVPDINSPSKLLSSETINCVPDSNLSSEWSSYPAFVDKNPLNPVSVASRPFHASRSTLHYRQNPGCDPVTLPSNAIESPMQHSNTQIYSHPSDDMIQESTIFPQVQPSVLPSIAPNGSLVYPCKPYKTYNHPAPTIQSSPAGLTDQHLRPSAPVSPNMVSPEHSRTDDVKCNGVGVPEGTMNYPNILPKVPGTPPSNPPKRRQPMDRATRNERRRQQRLRKKQEALMIRETGLPVTANQSEGSRETTPSNKRVRNRSQKKEQKTEEYMTEPAVQPSLSGMFPKFELVDSENSVVPSSSPTPTQSAKRRRAPERKSDAKRLKHTKHRELRPKVDTPTEDSCLASFTQDSATDHSQITEPSTEAPQAPEPVKQVRLLKPRPRRPKKRRPLPTLIRKKKRCAFYGDDSDSEPDISGKLSGRSTEARIGNSNASHEESKRRSERTAGDRKRYTVDLDLNLTDDSDTGDEEMATLNATGSAAVTDENDIKVVESVLGRRVTKRVVKKIIQKDIAITDANDQSTTGQLVEEEEEEDVEEFYLKYKGYSYLHCEWRALDEIDDPRIRPKMKRFEMKQANTLQGEDEDVVLFNPDYVEVERVLDMKVYRNGELLTSENARRRAEPDSSMDSTELKRKLKRERERKRAQALREAKIKARAEAEAAFAASNTHSVDGSSSSSSSSSVQDNAGEHVGSNGTNLEEAANSPNTAPGSVISQEEAAEPSNQPPELLEASKTANSPSSPCCASEKAVESVETNEAENNTRTESVSVDQSQASIPDRETIPNDNTCESHADDSVGALEQEDGSSSPVNVTYYLVKWRSLAYEDATWELAQDVDPAKVKEFLKWRNPPKTTPVPRDSDFKIIRPDPSTWRPIESDEVYKNGNKLRDYQLEGVNWLTYCWFHHRNCILADEMGLGKTVQSVTFLLELVKAGIHGPFLVIVPLSTVTNWQREFENWADFNVIIYHGSSTSRNMIQEYEIFYKRRPSDSAVRHDVYKFNVLVTTFEVLMTDIEFFGRIHWAAAVIDEAHRLKNKKCKLGEGLRYLELDHRVLLTGTPLQNNVEELFGLLNFLEPDRFNCSSTFVAEYGDLKTEEQVESLKALLKPMMLRRLKEDVEKSLAPKEETIVEVELTNIQKKYYRAIMERNFTFLCKGSSAANAPNLMNVMMELRKCCNHPFLIKGAEDAILADMREQNSSDDPSSDESKTFQALVYASGKLVLIHKLLPKLRADGHKVLIFSQMIRVLDILEDYLIHQRFQFERIDGRIQGPLRQEAIDRFTADPDKFVFLLCTKAGGLGINLTAADVVIIYDSDWNPQNDLQAQARCHRIGQQKMVKVYRLITRNTYEREMFDRASLKLGLDKAVLQSMGSKEARQAQMSKKEIEELLKKGAYGALMDDDKAGEDFCEEDIDKILQSRARVVQLDHGEKNSTFSKATFSISDNRSDIEIDDPNFWQKWAKMAGVDETAGTFKDLIMKTPRQRRQTNRYSAIEPAAPSPPSYDVSDLDDSATAQSSGDDNPISGPSGRGRFRRSRRHRRHGRQMRMGRRASQPSMPMDQTNSVAEPPRIEPLDRADLFRVERCLLTWPWGHWDVGLATVPFKRTLQPSELTYFACAVLSYALRFLPPTADPRVRATIVELTRPGVWRLELSELAQIVARATKRVITIPNSVDIAGCESASIASEPQESKDIASDLVSVVASAGAIDSPLHDDSTSVTLAPVEFNLDNTASFKDKTEGVNLSPAVDAKPSELSETPKESDTQDVCDVVDETKLVVAEASSTDLLCQHETEPVEPTEIQQDDAALKMEDDEDGEETSDIQKNQVTITSPKSASFDPDILIPFESFRKHVQRGGVRLLNRVAFLFFLECEVIGVERSTEFIHGRLTHSDFNDLNAILPPLEAIDADLPVPWWDSCCDKCLLLGVIKHGWEKYASMRLDPALCFWSRAMAKLEEKEAADDAGEAPKLEPETDIQPLPSMSPTQSDCPGTPNTEPGDKKEEIPESDKGNQSDTVEALTDESKQQQPSDSPAANSKLEDLPEPKLEENADVLLENEAGDEASTEAVLTAIQFPAVADLNSRIRKLVGFFLRVKNQHEVESLAKRQLVDDSEDQSIPPQSTRFMERKTIKWTRREEADFYRVVSSFGVEFTPITPVDKTETNSNAQVHRRYSWYNFRQLANLNRKSDEALTEYFQSFYRMCQRVCKRPLTEFAGPASTAITTTTSGYSAQGDEVRIDPISEERATRCLSRIDLLARIRNEILPHPHLTERLKLCQRGSEIPSWWITGKHDGELLLAVAKHGLARTDLNILSDPEFSFSRVISLIRERLKHEAAVAEYPGDLNANQTNRANIAAVAAAAARAAAKQIVDEDSAAAGIATRKTIITTTTNTESQAGSTVMTIDDEKKPENVEETEAGEGHEVDEDEGDTMVKCISSKSNVDSTVSEHNSRGDNEVEKHIEQVELAVEDEQVETKSKDNCLTEDIPKPTNNTSMEESSSVPIVSITADDASKSDEAKPAYPSDVVSNEWSVKFATNLATAWPKDRTIQHRLELVCQTIERNEWPIPRRYVPPSATVSFPIMDPNRALIESRIINFSTTHTMPRLSQSPYASVSPIPGRMLTGLNYERSPIKQLSGVRSYLPENIKAMENFRVIHIPTTTDESDVNSGAEDLSRKTTDSSVTDNQSDAVIVDPSSPLNLVGSPNKQTFNSSPYSASNLSTSSDIAMLSSSAYAKLRSGTVTPSPDVSSFANYPIGTSTTSTRGRSRGRVRGSRAGGSSRGLGRPRQNASRQGVGRPATRNLSPMQSPTSDSGLSATDHPESSSSDHPMPPPPNAVGTPYRTGTRGRKRKLDSPRSTSSASDFASPLGRVERLNAKRDRVDRTLGHPTSTRSTRGSYRTGQSSDANVWDVRVPVISLVDGSLIYGDKAPKRRSLEAWLEANPNYMPYSVEVEDRTIYSRVASARGQDTHNMEAMAYKHYLNSLIASATASVHSPTSLTQTPPSATPSPSQPNKPNLTVQQQQQYLQLQQQQQLLAALSAYARHPAYANLVASALTSWQASGVAGAPSSGFPTTTESPVSSASSINPLNQTASGGSVSTRTRSLATRTSDSPGFAEKDGPPTTTSAVECSLPSISTSSTSSASTGSSIPTESTAATTLGMEAMLSAAYKQATTNLAYMYNPMAAVAAYSQMVMASSGNSLVNDASANNSSSLSGQQAALASLYTNYMLAAKQQHQQQHAAPWEQQRQQQQQQLAALAAAVASACGAGGVDPASLMSMLGGSGAAAPTGKPIISNSLGSTSISVTDSNASIAPSSENSVPATVAPDVHKPNSNINLNSSSLDASEATTNLCSTLADQHDQVDFAQSNKADSHSESVNDGVEQASAALDLSK